MRSYTNWQGAPAPSLLQADAPASLTARTRQDTTVSAGTVSGSCQVKGAVSDIVVVVPVTRSSAPPSPCHHASNSPRTRLTSPGCPPPGPYSRAVTCGTDRT